MALPGIVLLWPLERAILQWLPLAGFHAIGRPAGAIFIDDHCTAVVATAVDVSRRTVSQRLVWARDVVKREVLGHANYQLGHITITLEVDFLIIHDTPQPLDKDVVQRSTASVHADGYAFPFEHAGESRSHELRSVVAVEYVRLTMHAKHVFEAVHAERCIYAVADAQASTHREYQSIIATR